MATDGRGLYVSRRRFVQGAGMAGLGLLAGCGRPVLRSGQPGRAARIGFLGPESADVGPDSNLAAFREGMRQRGYLEGRDFVLEARFGEGSVERHAALAHEMLATGYDLFVAGGPGAVALREANATQPIVAFMGDPVRQGLALSFAHPGGNVTGLSVSSPALETKRLELLKETAGGASRIVAMGTALALGTGSELSAAAQALGIALEPLPVSSPEDLAAAFGAVIQRGADALLLVGLAPFERPVVDFAAEQRVPAMYTWRRSAESGGLMAYTPSLADLHVRAAYYVDRILKGAQPAELPIEQPLRFDFAINLKTAQALGLTVPQHVLLQATEVIQ